MALVLILPVAYSSLALVRTLPPAVIDLREPASTDETVADADQALTDDASDATLP